MCESTRWSPARSAWHFLTTFFFLTQGCYPLIDVITSKIIGSSPSGLAPTALLAASGPCWVRLPGYVLHRSESSCRCLRPLPAAPLGQRERFWLPTSEIVVGEADHARCFSVCFVVFVVSKKPSTVSPISRTPRASHPHRPSVDVHLRSASPHAALKSRQTGR